MIKQYVQEGGGIERVCFTCRTPNTSRESVCDGVDVLDRDENGTDVNGDVVGPSSFLSADF